MISTKQKDNKTIDFGASIDLTFKTSQLLSQLNTDELTKNILALNDDLDLRGTQVEDKITLNFTPFPFCMTLENYHSLAHLSTRLYHLVEYVIDVWQAGNDDKLNTFFDNYGPFKKLLFKQHSSWQSYIRNDFILTSDGKIKLNEFNAASPGALLTVGSMNSLIKTQMQNQFKESNFLEQKLAPYFTCADIIAEIEKKSNRPSGTIAILYDNNFLLFELYEFQKRLEQKGREAIVAHAKDCQYAQGILTINGRPISTVLNNFFLEGDVEMTDINLMMSHWQKRPIEDKNFLYYGLCQAIMDKAVLLIHGFAALTAIEDKRFFTILSHHYFSYLFNEEECQFLRTHVPYTFSSNLLTHSEQEEILQNKDHYVFKYALSGCGLGTFMGKEVTQETWNTLIKHSKKPFVVQERIVPLKLPIVIDNQTVLLNNNMSFYSVQGELYGLVSRLSDNDIINVTSETKKARVQPVVVLSN